LSLAYRGYSSSSGKPTEEGLKLDANAVMDFVDQELAEFYIHKGGVFVVGRSLGGAVAAAAI
jgi:abhydrolase domain-containing protein 13